MTAIISTGVTAFAESSETINAIFGRIKLVVNNMPVEQETLLYNGTTYVPLRVAAEVLDKDVVWGGDNNTAYINDKEAKEETAVLPKNESQEEATTIQNKEEDKKEKSISDVFLPDL